MPTPKLDSSTSSRARPRGSLFSRTLFCGLLLTLALAVTGDAVAQEPPQGEEFVPRALVVVGFQAEPAKSSRANGYEVLDARLGASGRLGLNVEYLVVAGTSPPRGDAGLLDARLTVPVGPTLRLTAGQFKVPFSREALMDPDERHFARRAQGPTALAPLRQVGWQLSGAILQDRLSYRFGMFNGEGRSSLNPDGDFLYAGRVEFSREPGVGRYFDELELDVGASLAFSQDSARDVSDAGPFRTPGIDPSDFRGERLMWGGDLRVAYRRFFLDTEYARTHFESTAPGPGPGTQVAQALYADVGSQVWPGVFDLLVRWDSFDPPVTSRRDFLVLGGNFYPGPQTRLGFQYAVRMDDDPAPPPDGLTSPPSPLPGELADGQFIVRLEASL